MAIITLRVSDLTCSFLVLRAIPISFFFPLVTLRISDYALVYCTNHVANIATLVMQQTAMSCITQPLQYTYCEPPS